MFANPVFINPGRYMIPEKAKEWKKVQGFSQIPVCLHIPPKYSYLFGELFALQNMVDEAVIGYKLLLVFT